jgi:hypothetical protein
MLHKERTDFTAANNEHWIEEIDASWMDIVLVWLLYSV